MKLYRVEINIESTIEAEDETEAVDKFMESISWKDCCVSEIENIADKGEEK